MPPPNPTTPSAHVFQTTTTLFHDAAPAKNPAQTLFTDVMFGHSLPCYVAPDVPDRPALVDLLKVFLFLPAKAPLIPAEIRRNRGPRLQRRPVHSRYINHPSLSLVLNFYIPVDPHKPSGQSLFRQYANKKGKVVLDARWIRECIKAAQLQTFATNWAGCKVDGTETSVPLFETRKTLLIFRDSQIQEAPAPQTRTRTRQVEQPVPAPVQAPVQPVQTLHQHQFVFEGYVPPIQVPSPTPQPWQPAVAIAPEQTHIDILHRPTEYRQDTPWNHYHQPEAPVNNPAPVPYDYTRYREDENGWAGANYYDPAVGVSLIVPVPA